MENVEGGEYLCTLHCPYYRSFQDVFLWLCTCVSVLPVHGFFMSTRYDRNHFCISLLRMSWKVCYRITRKGSLKEYSVHYQKLNKTSSLSLSASQSWKEAKKQSISACDRSRLRRMSIHSIKVQERDGGMKEGRKEERKKNLNPVCQKIEFLLHHLPDAFIAAFIHSEEFFLVN